MKTSLLKKSMLGVMLAFICSMTISAITPKNYLHDTKEENGKIVSKTIFLEQQGILNQQIKYEFAYNEDGKVSEKKAFRWNKDKTIWEPFFLISYQYDNENEEIHSTYGMWNKKSNDYSLNIQEMTSSVSAYDEIFS